MTLRLPNCELTPGRIPEAGAEWSDISPFAASFDGYAVTAPEWRSEVLERLGVTAGLVGAGEISDGPITVALIQALVQWPSAELESFLSKFGLLVLDLRRPSLSDRIIIPSREDADLPVLVPHRKARG